MQVGHNILEGVHTKERSKRTQINKPCQWSQLPLGWIKINFDVAYSDGVAHPAVIIWDLNSTILTAWVTQRLSDGPYAAEAMAAEMALKQVELNKSNDIIIEGDAQNVIHNINKFAPLSDWRGQEYIQNCQTILARNPKWKVQYTPNSCNKAAHNLAAWATHSSICGYVDPVNLPPNVLLCDADTSDFCSIVATSADDDSNG